MKIWVFLLQRPYSRTPLLSQALSIIFAVAAGAFSIAAAQPSDALLRIIPDVQQSLKSGNWTNRAEVLDLLVRRLPGSGKPEFESRHDLPRSGLEIRTSAVVASPRRDVHDAEQATIPRYRREFSSASATSLGLVIVARIKIDRSKQIDDS